MNGVGMLLKGMGIDVEDVLTQARSIGEAFQTIHASQVRCEGMLAAICDRLEIARPMSPAELKLIEAESQRFLEPTTEQEEAGLANTL
jgi:orotate phosphoribosyltransferase